MSRTLGFITLFSVFAVVISLAASHSAYAQVPSDPIARRLFMSDVLREKFARLPEGLEAKDVLSGAAYNLYYFREAVDRNPSLKKGPRVPDRLSPNDVSPQSTKAYHGDFVNVPETSAGLFSHYAGATQNEPEACWAGDTVVVGYNNSAEQMRTFASQQSPSGSFTFNGLAVSHDAGKTLKEVGLVADPLAKGTDLLDLGGDPVLGCTSEENFYYASLGTSFRGNTIRNGIALSRSVDGGETWITRLAFGKLFFNHFLDKPWMAVTKVAEEDKDTEPKTGQPEPGSDVIVITYTDFDFSFMSEECPGQDRTAIEMVKSEDGGRTWTRPMVIDEVCGFAQLVQASQVEIGPDGQIVVSWERYAQRNNFREIWTRTSADWGKTFGEPVLVSNVEPIGDGFAIQGLIRAGLDNQGLDIDPTNPDRIYITWHDGRHAQHLDFNIFQGCPAGLGRSYCFGDILQSMSEDGGQTWSAPVQVNDNAGELTDQWLPATVVDSDGNIHVVYYDRRDQSNFLVHVTHAVSKDGGQTWEHTVLSKEPFVAITAWQDLLLNPFYMGDYNSCVIDVLGEHDGVFCFVGDNSLGEANVRVFRLP